MRLSACIWALIAFVRLTTAHAQNAPSQALVYTNPPEVQGLRIAVEELAVLLAGTGYYFVQHDVNSLDWTYDYSWATLQAKIVGDGYAFDTNYFRTNTLAHTGSGTLYYLAARGNGLSFLSSLGIGIVASTGWELLAEFRERMSINDMLITPLGGAAFGETMAQVGSLFTGKCAVIQSPILHALFAPSHALHSWIDGRPSFGRHQCDTSRLAEQPLRVMLGTAFSSSESRAGGPGWLVLRGEARVLTLPVHHAPQEWHTFSEGNWARLNVRTAIGVEPLQDIEITARTIPFGAWYDSLKGDARALFGVGVGAVFSEHAYGRPPERRDPLFVLEVPAFGFNYRVSYGAHRLDLTLIAATSFAEVGAFALPDYVRNHDVDRLTPVAAVRGYNHAIGVVLAPELRWSAPQHELTVSARSDRMLALRHRIGDELASSTVRGQEYRRYVRTVLSVGSDTAWRLRSELDLTQRRGTLGSVERHVVEAVWTTGVEGRF